MAEEQAMAVPSQRVTLLPVESGFRGGFPVAFDREIKANG